jgi:hypothetical protein
MTLCLIRTRMRAWRHGSTVLDLGTRWMSVVSFTPRPLIPQFPLKRGSVGPVWTLWYTEKSLTLADNRTPAFMPSLYRLPNCNKAYLLLTCCWLRWKLTYQTGIILMSFFHISTHIILPYDTCLYSVKFVYLLLNVKAYFIPCDFWLMLKSKNPSKETGRREGDKVNECFHAPLVRWKRRSVNTASPNYLPRSHGAGSAKQQSGPQKQIQ